MFVQKTKIGVVGGLGHIGLIQAACLAKLGYKTIAYDKNSFSVNEILAGKMPFFEPELEEVVSQALDSALLEFTSRIDDLGDCDVVFICVGTPSLPTGKADVSQVYSAIKDVARHHKRFCLVVIKSTVPVGTCRKVAADLDDNKLSSKVAVISNPEFLREGSGVQDFFNPSRIIVGAQSKENAEKVAGLYRPPGVPVVITEWENAELIKYASNTFLANKISFINEIACLSEKAGADIRVVSQGIGLDPRISPHFLEAGVGFSGPCLEKDLKSLICQFREKGEQATLLQVALDVNERQRRQVVQKLLGQLGTLKGKKIAVLGLAFKAETDDIRSSHSLPIIKDLLLHGASLCVHDPWVKNFNHTGIPAEELDGVKWAATPYEAVENKDAVIILTAWPQYRELDLMRVKALLSYPLIVDGRNLFNKLQMKELGITYVGFGV